MGRKKKDKDVDLQDAADEAACDATSSRYGDIDASVAELCETYDIDIGLAQRLDDVLDSRDTFRQDMKMLYRELDKTKNPDAVLEQKLQELRPAVGQVKVEESQCFEAVKAFCKMYRLDQGATAKLLDAMAVRERKFGSNIDQDLKILGVHLENSNAPSKLVSMKLKDIRAGYKLGNCVYARETEIAASAKDGGPSVDGGRSARQKAGYSDRELTHRFGAVSTQDGVMMTEEQARNFQRSMRQADAKAAAKVEPIKKDKKDRASRKRSRSRRRSRKRSRSRSGNARGKRRRSRSRSDAPNKEKQKRSRSESRSRSKKKTKKK